MDKEFRKRMGLSQVSEVESREKFLNRINVSILRWLQNNKGKIFYDEKFIWWVSEELGEAWGNQVYKRDYDTGYWSEVTMEMMTRGDFYQTLAVLEKVYQYIEENKPSNIINRYNYNSPGELINLHNFNQKMNKIMLLSGTDLGIFWKNGKFYPAGAKELDKALIADTLEWLSNYPKTKQQFAIALDHYSKSLQSVSAGKDAITNAYTSLESLSREILKNNDPFEKNSNKLVKKLELPKEYKNIVHHYKQVAHEYGSRHAGSNPNHNEVEAFIYLTGLLLRLMTNK